MAGPWSKEPGDRGPRIKIRPAAVAGTWYPGTPAGLSQEVDALVARAAPHDESLPSRALVGLIAPHAGMMYSGGVAAHAYRAAAGTKPDVVAVVGPSHFVGFDGVAICDCAAFETPLGVVTVDERAAEAIMSASPNVRPNTAAHAREHSLEMQLPFLQRVLPGVPIVPLAIGFQTRETILDLARALVAALDGRRPLLVASTDLSHYFDAETAARLDSRVADLVTRFDDGGLLSEFERYPEHERGRYVACGGGAAIAVMRAARCLGAVEARVLKYAHSGEVSGDNEAVVGYLAAGLWKAN
ncbi:MAG TPA: AmmeMemoRadiSam system protein B [Vicinamibacterales bacterium]|nr:AmmeMemoRadiSam system protein B [Vicinamibacterales bacterium]